MTTVLVRSDAQGAEDVDPDHSHVHHLVDDLPAWLKRAGAARP
jgi:hypothetical protein